MIKRIIMLAGSVVSSKEMFYFATGLIGGLLFALFRYTGLGLEYLPGDLGDTRFNLFILEHAKQFFSGDLDQYWSAGFMYPEAEAISLSDNLLGSAPVYALLRWAGLDIFTAFQWWVIIVALLNYTSAYLLIKYLVKSIPAAVVGAFIFAFSVSLISQMNHAQTFPRFAAPLSLLFLFMWLKRGNAAWFAASITLVVYQFYCGIYLGFMWVLPYTAAFLIGLISCGRSAIKTAAEIRSWIVYIPAIAINAFLLKKLFDPYLRRAEYADLHPFDQILHSVPELLSYLSVSSGTLLHGYLESINLHMQAHWDHNLFPGWIAVIGFIATGIAVLLRFRLKNKPTFLTAEQNAAMIAGIITFITYLKFNSFSLYSFLHELPGFGVMRLLTRIINIEVLFFGIATALAVAVLFKRTVNRYHPFFFAGLLLLIFVDNVVLPEDNYRIPKSEMRARHQNLIDKIDHLPAGTVISYEPDTLLDPPRLYHLDAMLAAQSLGMKSVNGYSGTAPYTFDLFWNKPGEETREIWFRRFPDHDYTEPVVIK